MSEVRRGAPTRRLLADEVVLDLLERLSRALNDGNLRDRTPEAVRVAHVAVTRIGASAAEILDGNAILAESATVIEPVLLGPNVLIGPSVSIGPFAYLRKSVICLPGVRLGTGVEADTTILFAGAKVAHAAFIGSCTVGERANLGYGAVFASRRLDGRPVSVPLDETRANRWDSGRKHHSAVVGAWVQLGVNVALMPGATVLPRSVVPPGKIVAGVFQNDTGGDG